VGENEMQQFWKAVQQGRQAEVLQQCGQQPSLLQAKAANGHGVVRMACDCQQFDLARDLAAAGAPVGLFEFIGLDDRAQVGQCLDDDPQLIQSYSHDGWTPLHLAGFYGRGALVVMLLERGADVDARSTNDQHNQPLHATLAGARPRPVVEALLDAGADLQTSYGDGITPLHLAASRGDQALVDLLLARGARAVPMGNGDMPADLARQRGFDQLADHLAGLAGV
jgi:hypothetical protein